MKPLLFFSLSLLLFTAACEDASNVGLGVLGEDSVAPGRVQIPADSAEAFPLTPVTGFEIATPTRFVLTGRAEDPVFGTIESAGYLDFAQPASITTAFRDSVVRKVELRLDRRYVYGDTTGTLTLAVHDMPETWTASGARADTTLTAGSLVTDLSVPVNDSLIVVPLPEAWVAANDTTLRSTRFTSVFHGFALRAESAAAVIGLNPDDSVLRVYSGADTLDYPVVKLLSTHRRTSEGIAPPGLLPLQDGLGPGLSLSFLLTADSLRNSALNRASLIVQADTVALQSGLPPGFVRPAARTLSLFGIQDDDEQIELLRATLDSTGAYVFSNALLTAAFQEQLLKAPVFKAYLLAPPADRVSLDALLVRDLSAATPPRLTLTLVTDR